MRSVARRHLARGVWRRLVVAVVAVCPACSATTETAVVDVVEGVADCSWLEADNCWRDVADQLAACAVGLGTFDTALQTCEASGGTVTLAGSHASLREWYDAPTPATVEVDHNPCAILDIDLAAPSWTVTVGTGSFSQAPLELDLVYTCPDGGRYAVGPDLDSCPDQVAMGPGLAVAWWSDAAGEGLVASTNPSVEIFACTE